MSRGNNSGAHQLYMGDALNRNFSKKLKINSSRFKFSGTKSEYGVPVGSSGLLDKANNSAQKKSGDPSKNNLHYSALRAKGRLSGATPLAVGGGKSCKTYLSSMSNISVGTFFKMANMREVGNPQGSLLLQAYKMEAQRINAAENETMKDVNLSHLQHSITMAANKEDVKPKKMFGVTD
eukprot:CAMPEP_0170495956 /NCGR_PEP_ID=MMETSP0208-20121228/19492_1 /TAXON_ID=197538 /ORGANISM="Strombidium inclinatum, Strain S3" /LENGTH=178 /DNA_ID=CAMNT_0010772373 /DNA_START=1435 /DNA_END=1971 /DNA_ORIENTATION=-